MGRRILKRGVSQCCSALLLSLLPATCTARVFSIEDYGAIAGYTTDPSTLLGNKDALQNALNSAHEKNDTVVIPDKAFSLVGGARGSGLADFTLDIQGVLNAVHDTKSWPQGSDVQWFNGAGSSNDTVFYSLVDFTNCEGLTITSSTGRGLIDGNGQPWWAASIVQAGNATAGNRPVMMSISYSSKVLVERIAFVNGPHFHLYLSQIYAAEIRFVNVTVDRQVQQDIKKRAWASFALERPDLILQPWDLNTDGIDVAGEDVWIHDVVIRNDDDSIAVKPNKDCNVRVEDSPHQHQHQQPIADCNASTIGPLPGKPSVCSMNSKVSLSNPEVDLHSILIRRSLRSPTSAHRERGHDGLRREHRLRGCEARARARLRSQHHLEKYHHARHGKGHLRQDQPWYGELKYELN